MVCAEQQKLRVDKYATISNKTNRYSVPDHLVGKMVTAKVTNEHIEVFNETYQCLALHESNYGAHQWAIAIAHYLDTFKKKPGALSGSVALASSQYLSVLYHQYFRDTPRAFIEPLSYCYEHHIEDHQIKEAITRLEKNGIKTIEVDKIKVQLRNRPATHPVESSDDIALYARKQISAQAAFMN